VTFDAQRDEGPVHPAVLLSVLLPISGVAADSPGKPSPNEVVIRRLVEALNDSDLDVRQNLGVALAKIGPASVEPLTAALKDKSADRRAGAAYALGLIGSEAKTALPELLELLKDDDVGVRRQASFAIGRIVPAGLKPGVIEVPASGGGGSK
jgi:hypothetical protein